MSEKQRLTGRGEPFAETIGTPTAERLPDGQFADHWVLSEEERAKGFVRPVRDRYRHVGQRPKHPLRELTDEERERFAGRGYVGFEIYPETRLPALGRYWTEAELNSGCGQVTLMPLAIAETYARDPSFYGATFCAVCRAYFRVGESGEFEWLDGTKVGT